jgi:hypothetical protein
MYGIFLAVLVQTASASASVVLWRNVSAGMTIDQLKEAQPSTVLVPSERKRSYLGNCTYTSGKVDLFGESFDVCYEVQSDRVKAVILHGSEVNASPVTIGLLKPALAEKYGSPVLDSCSSLPMGKLCKTVWRLNGLSVTATHTTIVGVNALTVTYDSGSSASDAL